MEYIENYKINSRNEFKKYIGNEDNYILLFNASWCGPCKRMKEFIKNNIEKLNKKIILIDVDECRDIANKYKVRSYPTLISFKEGLQDQVICNLNENLIINTMKC
jgi:thioredoxin 1